MTLVELRNDPLVAQRGARKSEAVYQELKRRILLGLLTYESPITEQALAQEYECSQGTVREALLRLQECGLVDRRSYQGTFVTRTTTEEAVVMVRLRLNLECACIERVVAAMTDRRMSELRKLDSMFWEHRNRHDVFGTSEMDRIFHRTLFGIAEMPMLEPILRRTLLQLHRYMISQHQGNIVWMRHPVATHGEILDAISDRDVATARKLAAKHISLALALLAPEVYETVFGPMDDETAAADVNIV